ncbi:MAG: LysM peptidoglycan-binding domain-containing protein [Pirellulales bacterium]
MQSLKTGFVVVLLAAMLYGIYVVVNTPPTRPPREVEEHLEENSTMLVVDEGGGDEATPPDSEAANAPASRVATRSGARSGSTARELRSRGEAEATSPAARELPGDGARPPAPPPLGPGAGLPPAPPGGDVTEPRSPVGLEKTESIQPPTPPSRSSTSPAGDAAPTVPVPDLTTPPAGSAPSAGGPPPAVPFGGAVPPAFSRSASPSPDSTADSAPGSSPAPSGAEGVPPSTETSAAPGNPGGSFNANPAPAQPDATAESNPAVPGSPAPRDSSADSGPLAPGQEGVRFDPKEAVFERGWKAAQQQLADGQPVEALTILSHLYTDPRLNAAERRQLQDALDPLAAQVIYSTDHLLEQPFIVKRGDTLQAVAEQYRVPWQLLANINGIRDPGFLVPGTRLKVLRGPFRAEVDLEKQEITVFWRQLYAGRFPVSVGQEPAPAAGEFEIKEKLTGRDYVGADGRTIPGGHPANPYGNVVLDLGRNLAIHSSALSEAAPTAGCISLSPRDAEDVFAILSVGSSVTIRR